MQVYRRHVRRTLTRAVRELIPRTAARLGEGFGASVERSIEDESPRSPYFRDIAFEFCTWAQPRWGNAPSVPGYLIDLARYELASFEVGCVQRLEKSPSSTELTLEGPVGFSSAARLVRYEHAIHRLDASLDARDSPEAVPTALLIYRDADDEVRFLELTPLAAAIIERLLRGEALSQAVLGASCSLGFAVDANVTRGTAELLDNLVKRGVIQGGDE